MPIKHEIKALLSGLILRSKGIRLFNENEKKSILERYSQYRVKELGYATVKDFCDSADYLPQFAQPSGTLKEVQRPWIIKAILGQIPIGARLLEIGGGDPFVASALQKLGYDATVIDPYDGAGNGPQAYNYYVKAYPKVRIIRTYFQKDCPQLTDKTFDCIFSVSVLEHVPHDNVQDLFDGISQFLKPGGYSIHCIDHVVEGQAVRHNQAGMQAILSGQYKIQNPALHDSQIQLKMQKAFNNYLEQLKSDIETYYNSPLGHNRWRKALKKSYDEYPYRKIVSLQTCVKKSEYPADSHPE